MSWRRVGIDPAGTQRAGEDLAQILMPGDIVLLIGTLGAGKTTFTQGVARGLGVTERVTSPTFTVVREHRCHAREEITTLHHADIYRVESLGEVTDLALAELVEECAVAVVEWGEIAEELFGPQVLRVRLSARDDDARTIEIDGDASRGRESLLERWRDA